MNDPKDEFYEDGPSADPEYDGGLGSGDWLRGHIRHQERGGGWSQADLPLTAPERSKLGIKHDPNPPMAEREERAEMEER